MKKVGAAFCTVSAFAAVACLASMQLQGRAHVRTPRLGVENLEQILLSRSDAQKLVLTLEKVLSREPRDDAPGASDPSAPVSPFDSADFDVIRRCVCIIKEQLKKVCSKLEKLDRDLSIHDAVICSKLIDIDEDLSRHDEIVNSKLDDLDEDLSHHDAVVCTKLIDLDEDLSRHDSTVCTKLIDLDEDLSRHDVTICSKIGDLGDDLSQHDATVCTKLIDLDDDLSSHDEIVNSKLDDLDEDLSRHDAVICVKLINLDDDLSTHDTIVCSKLSDLDDRIVIEVSAHDAVICSKIGQFDDEGSCFEDPQILPDGINDAQLNVIQWLKSIMLTLYGCTDPISVDDEDPFVNPFP